MSEKEISETERKSKVIPVSIKMTQGTKELFDDLKLSGAYDTAGMFMDALLEHYQNPLKVNKDYEAKIESLKAEVKRLENEKEDAVNQLSIGDSHISKLRDSYEELKQAYNEKCSELESVTAKMNEYRGMEHKMDGHILVPVDELDMRCLQYLSDRENETRHRDDITPPVFFQYAVREMLIKGNKFAIPCVPDRKLEQFKKEIANGQ